ncbi:MAG TPA: FkbM family methyltransferase [Jatrophihabitans sp.]|jgi:FkbM family methyltransferase|nr:FkbM family methyltransferase [Jatrophihabitans sp.]
MNRQPSLAQRAVHGAKMLVHRAGFDVSRDTFKHRFVYQLHRHGIDTVLDIGANTGQFARLLRQSGFSGRIHSVEPLQRAFLRLENAARADTHWTVQRAAVGAATGTLTMNVSGNSVSSSVLPMLDRHEAAAPSARYVAQEKVPAVTVDDIVSAHDLAPERTLLKVDVQGYEKAVLDGAAQTLPKFRGVRTEMSLVPLYDGQALMPEIVGELGELGFELWFVEPGFVEPETRRLLQLDGVFFSR